MTITNSVRSAINNDPVETLSGLVQALLTDHDPGAVLPEVLRHCARALEPSLLQVYSVVPSQDDEPALGLSFSVMSSGTDDRSQLGRLSSDALDPWSTELLAGQPLLVSTDALPRVERCWLEKRGFRSILALPVLTGPDLSAVLISASEQDETNWTNEHRAICEQAAIAVGLARLREKAAAHDRLMAALAYSFDIISIVGPDGTILFNSPAFVRVLGPQIDDRTGHYVFTGVHPEDQSMVDSVFTDLLSEPGRECRIEVRLKHGDGSWRNFEVLGANQSQDPQIGGVVVTAHDITERKRLEKRLNWQALHDPLTKLANRTLLQSDMQGALARANRAGTTVGLLYLDLDGFKQVNDRLGHAIGDRLLARIGERLRAAARAGETVARLGGDEFVVLLEGLTSRDDAEHAASRILEAIRLPVHLDDHVMTITASIGISLATGESIEPDDLLIRADTALYAAKRAGRACYRHFDEDALLFEEV